ncbi:hypothetical protein [Saccharopolyspora soli]|nr:hypothetical protein [Saccharopolyspora soli]
MAEPTPDKRQPPPDGEDWKLVSEMLEELVSEAVDDFQKGQG